MRRKTIDTIPVLPGTMKNIWSAFSKSRSLLSVLVKRASIIQFASQGKRNQNITPQDRLHYNNISIWRSWFLTALPTLRKQDMLLASLFRKGKNTRNLLHRNRISLPEPSTTHSSDTLCSDANPIPPHCLYLLVVAVIFFTVFSFSFSLSGFSITTIAV